MPSLRAASPELASHAPSRRQLQFGSTRKERNGGYLHWRCAPTSTSQTAQFQAPCATPPKNSGLFILRAPKWVALISWRDIAAALNPHNTPTPLCTLIPDAQLSHAKAQARHCHVARWPCLHLYSSPRLPLELDLLLLHGIVAIVCNRTFISGFSLVQSKLILLADFSTVSRGSYGTLSMLLALMMHNTNPSLEQECALMMD